MASRSDSAGSLRPRSRRSIAHVPRSKLTSGIDQENNTTDIAAIKGNTKVTGKDKKSRSKSLGPGGLDALQDSNGNRRKSTLSFPLKSILKPTVPVSPVRNIPTFEETRRRTPARGETQNITATNDGANDQNKEGLLIDFGTPAQPSGAGTDNLANPFDTFNASSAIRDGLAAAKEREEQERREQERRERERKRILEQREARRKSMANRRVSFAPEATLHTWNVVEIPDDSTSSSTSNSTRRASSLANSEDREPAHVANAVEPPSSPDVDMDSDSSFSPVPHQDLQQIRDRPESASNSQDFSSSPFSGSSVEGNEDTGVQSLAREEDDDDDNSSDSDTGFEGESTAMSMDDMTARSAVMTQSDDSTSSSARLNEALRQAAREAGTRGIDYDENGDMSMEIADQEITGAFQPWIKKGERKSFEWDDISALHDQENINPAQAPNEDQALQGTASDNEEDMSMDVTNAIGGIISKPLSRRQSAVRRKSSGEETNYEEQTMEFTNVVGGGIAPPISPARSIGADSNVNEDEEMTMEFTSVVGGLLGKNSAPMHPADENNHGQTESFESEANERNFSEWNDDDDDMEGMDMEITGAIGGILPTIREQSEMPDDDRTVGMDVTTAMGRILPPALGAEDKLQAKKLMELESDSGQLASSPFQESVPASPRKSPAKSPSKSPAKSPSKTPAESPAKSTASFHVATVASESGSPSLASVRSRPSRWSSLRSASNTPTSYPRQPSPVKKPSTPSKQLTPQAEAPRPTTPGKTPPSSNITFRSALPKKLFQPELQESASKHKSLSSRKSLFAHNESTGQSTPLFVLRPHERRSSGLGIDKEGLGSPRVAAMLDQRKSIGEVTPQFVPTEPPLHGVRFEDPIKLHEEVDREREEEEKREDGHIPPLQSSERDTTLNLKDMISSLTPKKNKLRGRKSLHVGAAKGLLGKRPIELDQDDDEVENSPKRLRGREASPVKSIRLPAPPTKAETVGRTTRSSARKALGSSPLKDSTTPTQALSNLRIDEPTPTKSGSQSFESQAELPPEEDNVALDDSEDKFEPIQLQEFLNMTNIHFMELTTTKRRHTTAPGSNRKARRSSALNEAKSASFEECVAAGFCTVPMLELYQHSCRELKSYISEGRQVIRSIETETYADNPPLFREYVTAPPDIRLLMDNQFRNVKTHARLLSKATWYEWRMKLLEGLKEGLNRHVEEMKADDEYLAKHEVLLNDVVPTLVEKHSSLEKEATTLQQFADEMENCDQDELRGAREKLLSIEAEIVLKKRQLAEIQEEIQDKTDTIETGAELKSEYIAQIQEAERVKEECRGWSAKEINELKASVHNLESQTGWSILNASTSSESPQGPSVTMSYRNQLRLTFHPAAFNVKNGSELLPLELVYKPGRGNKPAVPAPQLSPIGSLVLKSLHGHLATVDRSTTAPKHVLRFISEAWDLVLTLEEEARMLQFCGVTKLRLLDVGDRPSLRARCTLLGDVPSSTSSGRRTPAKAAQKKKENAGTEKGRVDVDFAVRTRVVNGAMKLETEVVASKVYGFGTANDAGMSEGEMQDILRREMSGKKSGVQLGAGVWSETVRMLTATIF